ncbi:Glutamate racemase 2 [Calycomorphotria hydatis]|uniref:Glutamate racemase 2 n=2 Tax=Calycomorphotria hydatis TaxID=2528027 RepID=A0A517T5G4_9PLAN|nr:Glutamate racemase 2 [Calycomorphotria hydatis]
MPLMNNACSSKPIFLADSCIGGMSVLHSLWSSEVAQNAIFMADYAVNPLGVKSDAEISDVVDRWITAAENKSDVLVCACNTLSIRYQQLADSRKIPTSLQQIISMVDCFKEMVNRECERLANQRVLIIGTAFTASQPVYKDILQEAVPDATANSIAATELERAIARFESWETNIDSVITSDLREALSNTDFAVLACTCFPMAESQLRRLFPSVQFLDPGKYCHRLLQGKTHGAQHALTIELTGDVVSKELVTGFAASWLGGRCVAI